jgi:hypothetical protein
MLGSMQRTDTCLRPSTNESYSIYKSYEGFWLGNLGSIARLCALFKEYSGERSWKAIGDRLRRAYCLSRVDHVRKSRDRKQRTDIGKYSFVNRTFKNWNQLPAEALGTFPCEPKILEWELDSNCKWSEMKGIEVWRKSSTSAVKWIEVKCSDVMWNGGVGNLNEFKPNEKVVKWSEV